MILHRLARAGSAAVLLLVAACGGGGGDGGAPASSAGGAGSSGAGGGATSPPPPVVAVMSPADAVRLAKQASFGPTQPLVDHMTALKVGDWLEEQFAKKASTYADLAGRVVPRNFCTGKTGQEGTDCNREYFSSTPMRMRFYANAVNGEDQLRQRVAFALSQIIVASDVEVQTTAGLATFNQIFLDNAFGNYRDILKAVTLNPYMGDYLDMANSNKASPNENYARELMQLFSIGPNLLNADGTLQRDAAGASLPTYSGADVKEVARALTGWTHARLPAATSATDGVQLDFSKPMVVIANRYDSGAKTFLGAAVPAGASPEASVDAVIDAVFNHANTAPFVAQRLIQQLVTSNPSPAYVQRVAAVFANNGAGVRGDMKAVVRAILTDAEARGDKRTADTDGKVKEPVLLMTSLVRLIGASTDGYAFLTRDAGLGQAPFRAPSVFNFYPPDYPLAQGRGLVSPPGKLMSTAATLARHNLTYDWTVGGDSRGEFNPQTVIAGSTGTQLRWTDWEALAGDPDAIADRLDLLMLNKTMTPGQRGALKAAMTAITNTDPIQRARKRAQAALYIVASSPHFQIDR